MADALLVSMRYRLLACTHARVSVNGFLVQVTVINWIAEERRDAPKSIASDAMHLQLAGDPLS